ncbi:MAG: GEVED domain-containing protein, partial [Acidobacteriota bacterium]
GPSDDADVAVVDTPPAELSCTWTSAAAGGATGSAGSGSGDLAETLDLPAGSSVTYTLLCAIDPAAVGSLVNTASVTGSYDDGPTNDSATDEDNLSPRADLSMTKTNGVTESIPGTPTTYTLVTSNAGPSNDIAARVTDSLPPSLDCSWTSVGDGGATGSAGSGSGSLDETLALPVGASVTYTLDCTIDDAATGTLENTAEVAGSFDPDGANDSATDADDLLGLDYGDAPDSPDGSDGTYPTLVASDGARHVADGPLLGALRDSEDDGAPSPDALGDDGAGDADEDGVALPDFLACEPAVVGVTASEAARLDAWVDWNRDGDWLDDGERIFTDEPLTAGLNSLDVAVPCDTATGEGTAGGGAFARFRLSSAGGLEPSGLALDGEVEDYLATVLAQDFGDAPDTYGTLLADDGARHGAAGGALILGELWDPEADGQPSPAADGDDGGPPRDDEDGARFDLVELVSGQQVTLPVTVSGDGTRDGFLQMWIDFDRDGTFGEGDERVATDLAVPAAAGAQQVDVPFSVPAVGTSGPTFARIRIASTAGLPPIGAADDGEVEDYRVQLIPLPTLSIAPAEVVEGDGGPTDLVFTLVRSHNLSTAAVTVSTADGTAGAPADYAALAPTAVTFAPGGAMSRDITVRVEGDALVELDETLTLTVTDPVAIAAPGAAVGGILNDDAATVTLAPAETLEGDSGQSTLAFLATLDNAVDVAVTAGATTTDRSATVADGDYKPLSDQTVTFLGGAGEVQTIAVAVNGDTAIEAHEDLLLTVTDLQASGRAVTFAGDVSTLEAVGTILNDDALLRIDDASAPEGDSGSTELVFTVSLEGVIEGGFEVDVETEETGAPDGATSGPPEPDFLAVEETLVFTGDDGETRTVAVTVFGDTTPEPTETFRVRLAPPSGDGALPELADDEGLGTIEDDDDGVPPTVASLRSNAGEITACAQLRGAAIRTLTVRVEDERSAILGGDRPADYLLVRPGADGDFDTESCAGGVQGDDLAVPIRGVTATYGAMSLLATLDVGPLAPGVYRSLVCDSITDEALNPLDGDLDGLSGGDLVIPFFRSDAGNLFENGHLDGDAALCPPSLGGWIAEAEPPSLVETGLLELDDFEDAETSTSIRVTVDGGANGAGGAVLAQCVAADGGAPLLLNLQAQVRAPSGTVLLELGCRFFEETACAGAVAAESVAVVGLTGQPAPVWLPVSHGFAAPSDAASALCEVLTGSSQGTYELFLDALTLTPGAPAEAMIFSDGFESGNTSAWR